MRNPRGVRTRASQNQFTVIQPGSTVATSLVEGEAKPKHVALLSIKADNWKMESIPLTTVRPFLLREVVLAEHADEYELHDERTLMDMLGKQASRSQELRSEQPRACRHASIACMQVDEMLAEVKAQTATPITQAAENRAKFPLLRLKAAPQSPPRPAVGASSCGGCPCLAGGLHRLLDLQPAAIRAAIRRQGARGPTAPFGRPLRSPPSAAPFGCPLAARCLHARGTLVLMRGC